MSDPLKYFLVSASGQRTELVDSLMIGREAECDLVVASSEVSRRHARLQVDGGSPLVEDLSSVNGTFVGLRRITGICLLRDGDILQFGPESFTFEVHGQPPGPSARVDDTELTQEVSLGAAAQAAVDEEGGSQGGIEAMPVELNLPPAWMDQAPSETMVLSVDEIQRLADNRNAPNTDESFEARFDGPTLLMLTGKDAGRPYRLFPKGEFCFWTIGKGSGDMEPSILIDDPTISNFHAKLVYKSGRWKIVDQMSTNNTYVNGEEYNTAFLSSGDTLGFGRVSARFLLPGGDKPQGRRQSSGIGGFFKRLFGGGTGS